MERVCGQGDGTLAALATATLPAATLMDERSISIGEKEIGRDVMGIRRNLILLGDVDASSACGKK